MKRSPLKRSTKRIAQESEKHRLERELRREVVRQVRERDRVCQGEAVHALARVPCSGALEVHEVISRAQWRKGYLDPANCALLCHSAHMWVTAHPMGAHALGLVKWSYERGT